ncbi:hypothetical protein KCP76_22200 [Salmonella enterica subsp. enterica serovar Weltevreden]|nr:hypothetical protein KCP76_22200 [Salmonella enterica subsp. enterica serovar Weltevreden]
MRRCPFAGEISGRFTRRRCDYQPDTPVGSYRRYNDSATTSWKVGCVAQQLLSGNRRVQQ